MNLQNKVRYFTNRCSIGCGEPFTVNSGISSGATLEMNFCKYSGDAVDLF